MAENEIQQMLDNIITMLAEQNLFKKDVLSFNEATKYLDLSCSYLYKLTSKGGIAHYKPEGKKIYFLRTDLDNYLLRNRVKSADEIATEASTHVVLSKGRWLFIVWFVNNDWLY